MRVWLHGAFIAAAAAQRQQVYRHRLQQALLEEAHDLFAHVPFQAQFVRADLASYVPPIQAYDIAVSQAVLRHMQNPKSILKKMAAAVRPGGLVICIETDRLLEEAGKYFSNMDYAASPQTKRQKKLWERELAAGGRDYRTGIKIPQYMQELGLRDIQIRVNDCVKFANPHTPAYKTIFSAMAEANGWNRLFNKEEKKEQIAALIQKGLRKREAVQYFKEKMRIERNIRNGFGKEYILEMPCTPITFGRK